MDGELRCPSKLHMRIVDATTVETTCNSKFCGHGNGTVVLHRWDIATGKLTETLKFKQTNPRKDGVSNGS